jgi:VWFA-related protein
MYPRFSRLYRPLLVCCLCSPATGAAAQEASAPQAAAPTFQINVNRVLVPVVVRDKQGLPIADLKREDFEVVDNGKARSVSAFNVEQRGPAEQHVDTGTGTGPAPGSNAASRDPPTSQRFIVFLFDDIHLGVEDLAQVQTAGAAALDGLSVSDITGVVSISGKTNSGLTRDHTRLRDAIMSLQARNTFRPDPRACPNISYYQAVQIEREHSPEGPAFQEAFRQVVNCNPGLDPKYQQNAAENEVSSATNRVLNLGRQDAQTTYANIAAFVRTMGTLTGQRMLILVSPGFLPIEQESMTLESRVMDLAAQNNVTISALDARGLYTAELDASSRGSASQSDYNRTSMTLAEGSMESLADGTGGTFFHNRNDLGTGFKSLTETPEVVYVLELSLDGVKQDGTYHHLKVKVNRDGAYVRARRGYFMPKAGKGKK